MSRAKKIQSRLNGLNEFNMEYQQRQELMREIFIAMFAIMIVSTLGGVLMGITIAASYIK